MLIILRGLPGSTKTTQANYLFEYYKDKGDSAVVCSNDNYPGYYENGKYVWTPDKAKLANQYCKETFIQALNNDVDVIILDNTNLSPKKYSWYKDLAEKAHREISFVTFRPPLENPVALQEYCEFCAGRNTHGVSLQMIKQMAESWVD